MVSHPEHPLTNGLQEEQVILKQLFESLQIPEMGLQLIFCFDRARGLREIEAHVLHQRPGLPHLLLHRVPALLGKRPAEVGSGIAEALPDRAVHLGRGQEGLERQEGERWMAPREKSYS